MKIGLSGAFWDMPHTGSGQYTHNLLRAMADVGQDDLHLCLPRYVLGRDGIALHDKARGSWHTSVCQTPFRRANQNLAKLWFEQVSWPRWCRREGVDVAHVPYFAPSLCTDGPTVVTIHDLIPLVLPEYRGGGQVRAYMQLVSRAASRASMVLTDSEASRRDIHRVLGIPPERVRVIYLAADSSYRPMGADERAATLDRLGVPERYMLYLGGFDCRKNVPALLDAYGRVRDRLDVPLVVAGRLPREESAFAPDPRRVARELGLDEEVHFTGWIAEEDKAALYSGALVFVFPSRYEGFGLPVLEALSCGTPAIVGTGSSLEEVAGPGGIAVSPHDVGALAAGLVEIVGNGALRAELSQKGLAHAATFSWRRTGQETLAAYRDALDMGR